MQVDKEEEGYNFTPYDTPSLESSNLGGGAL